MESKTETVQKKKENTSRTKVATNQGIYISAPRCKYYLDRVGLNKNVEDIIDELKTAGTVGGTTKQLSDLSQATQTAVSDAIKANTDKLLLKNTKDKERRDRAKTDKELAEKIRVEDEKALESSKRKAENAVKKAADKEKRRVDREEKARAEGKTLKPQPVPFHLSSEINLVRKNKVRISKNVSLVTAALTTDVIEELIQFGLGSGDLPKTLNLKSVLAPGVEKLKYFFLYGQSDAFKNAQTELVERERQREEVRKRAAEAAAKETDEEKQQRKERLKQEREERKTRKESAAKEPKAKKAAAPAEADKKPKNNKDFSHYVRQIFYKVINERTKDPQVNVQLSKDVKKFSSDIIVSILNNLVPLIHEKIVKSNVKTVNDEIVLDIMKILFIFNKIPFDPIRESIFRNIKLYETQDS